MKNAAKNTATQKNSKPDDPAQYKRFIEAARKAEAKDSQEEADKAFKKVTARPHKVAK